MRPGIMSEQQQEEQQQEEEQEEEQPGLRSLQAAAELHLAAAAQDVLRLLRRRCGTELTELRRLLTERLSAAVELILTAVQEEREARRDRAAAEPRGELRVSGTSCPPGGVCEPEEEEQEDQEAHSCRVCSKSFARRGFLMKHVQTHRTDGACVCGLCGERLDCSERLRLHVQLHRDRSRTCDVCGRKFRSIRAQETHRRLHSGEPPLAFKQEGNMAAHLRTHVTVGHASPLQSHVHVEPHDLRATVFCKVCSEGFSQQAELRRHARSHAAATSRRAPRVPAPHRCQVCRSTFHNRGNFVRHAETHLDRPEPVCGVCGEQSGSPEGLRLHIQSHRETGRTCEVCGVRFRDMEIHMRSHTGQKPFSCTDCGKDFPRKGSLERHMKLHAGERPYICEFCGKTFMENTVLKRHIKSHTGGKPRIYSCDTCNKRFTMSQHLDVHKRIHTGEKPFTCRVCGKKFRQVGNLDSHMRIHTGEKPFICSLCGKTFRQKVSLETHERFHKKEKCFGCSLCTKSFVQKIDLKRHMMTHTGEKPHRCAVCGKSYQEKRSVDSHMKVHAAADRDPDRDPGPRRPAHFIQL